MAKFVTKFQNLRMTAVPTVVMTHNGQRTILQGKKAEFQNGAFETEDPELIEHIRNHRWFGVHIFEEDVPRRKKHKDDEGKKEE